MGEEKGCLLSIPFLNSHFPIPTAHLVLWEYCWGHPLRHTELYSFLLGYHLCPVPSKTAAFAKAHLSSYSFIHLFQ